MSRSINGVPFASRPSGTYVYDENGQFCHLATLDEYRRAWEAFGAYDDAEYNASAAARGEPPYPPRPAGLSPERIEEARRCWYPHEAVPTT